MNTGQSIIVSSLFLCWAMLLAARTVAAAIYSNAPAASYHMGLERIGWLMPVAAWLCFAAAVVMLWTSRSKVKVPIDAP